MYTIQCPLKQAAEISKHETALICPAGSLTFYQLHELVSCVAERLRKAGVAAGDRVGLAAGDGWRDPVAFLAVLRLGAIACPLSSTSGDADERTALKALECLYVVSAEPGRWKGARHGLKVLAAEEIVSMGLMGANLEFADRIPGGQPAAITCHRRGDGKTLALQSNYGALYYGALGCNVAVKLRSHDRWLLSSPLHGWDGIAILFRCLLSGATLVIAPPGEPLVESMEKNDVTHLSVGAGEVAGLFDGGRHRDRKLTTVLVNGAVSAEVLARAAKGHTHVLAAYCRPEIASPVTLVMPDSPPGKQTTSGRALKYRDLSIGKDGAILVRGQTLFSGYVEGGGVRCELDEEGWFATGDTGRLDEDGYLAVLTRQR